MQRAQALEHARDIRQEVILQDDDSSAAGLDDLAHSCRIDITDPDDLAASSTDHVRDDLCLTTRAQNQYATHVF
nr:hypothetical protein [uncultured Nocardioides sp.]